MPAVVTYLDIGVDPKLLVEAGGGDADDSASGPFSFFRDGDGGDHVREHWARRLGYEEGGGEGTGHHAGTEDGGEGARDGAWW